MVTSIDDIIYKSLNNNKKLEELSVQIETVREINEYDFKIMGQSYVDKIYEKYDVVQFGHYMQEKKGNKKQPIDWIVLDKKDDKVLLFSKYILDMKNYNDEDKEISWGDCSLRKWLNEVFYDITFSNDEKNEILETTNINNGYKRVPLYDTKDAYETVDKVFLLSQDEINTYFKNDGIYDSEWYKNTEKEEGVYIPSVANATTKCTDYAVQQYINFYDLDVNKKEVKEDLDIIFNKKMCLMVKKMAKLLAIGLEILQSLVMKIMAIMIMRQQ